jgi:glycosyltransferase involved in cell wall biosynthesis
MRVLMDARPAYGKPRGVGTYILQLASALERIAPEVETTLVMFSMRARRSGVPRMASPKTRVRVLRVPNGVCSSLLSWPLVNQCMRASSWGFDVTHDTGFEHFPFGRRVVFTLHDVHHLRMPRYQNRPETLQYMARIRLAASRAKLTITDSESTRRDAIELLGLDPSRTRTVLLGSPPIAAPRPDAVQKADRHRLSALGIRTPYILSLGDVIARKNNVTLVRALAALPPSIRGNSQLVVAGVLGESDVVDELRSEAKRLAVDDRLILAGFVDAETRDALLANAKLFAFPSLYEGFGLPILEAMARGVPVIAANNSSIPEVTGDAGMLVDDYRAPDAWAHALEQGLSNETWRAATIGQGYRQVEAMSWERTAHGTLESYRLAMTM